MYKCLYNDNRKLLVSLTDPVIEVMSENSSISTSLYDSTCSSEGFQHLEESVTTQFPFDDLDPSQAFFAEEVSKSELADIDLSPLLKEEIKHKIKRRRMAEGKEEIRVEFKEPSPERVSTLCIPLQGYWSDKQKIDGCSSLVIFILLKNFPWF